MRIHEYNFMDSTLCLLYINLECDINTSDYYFRKKE